VVSVELLRRVSGHFFKCTVTNDIASRLDAQQILREEQIDRASSAGRSAPRQASSRVGRILT
jgi:hypothetical protein